MEPTFLPMYDPLFDNNARSLPQTGFARFIMDYPGRLAMPIGVYAGLDITGDSVEAAVTDAGVQSRAVLALHERFDTPVMLTAMDLSAEAEAFGCTIQVSANEIPTVIGRRVTSLAEINNLTVPEAGEQRTAVHLEAARRLAAQSSGIPVLGGLIGPFSLAARLFGVSEALEATAMEPETILCLLEKATDFLVRYAAAFRQTGAAGVIMAEPAAGLLSPNGLRKFSAPYVRRIIEAVQTEEFSIILHNCGARLVHLPAILESGAGIYHFGAPMDLPAALEQVQGGAILCGNLDPSGIFYNGTPESVYADTVDLLSRVGNYRNFVLSSGCDLPPGTPVANLEAFYAANSAAEADELCLDELLVGM